MLGDNIEKWYQYLQDRINPSSSSRDNDRNRSGSVEDSSRISGGSGGGRRSNSSGSLTGVIKNTALTSTSLNTCPTTSDITHEEDIYNNNEDYSLSYTNSSSNSTYIENEYSIQPPPPPSPSSSTKSIAHKPTTPPSTIIKEESSSTYHLSSSSSTVVNNPPIVTRIEGLMLRKNSHGVWKERYDKVTNYLALSH